MITLEGRTVLITGATGNLGLPMALAAAAAGAEVIVNSREAERANAVVEQLRAGGHSARALVFDVANQGQMESAVASLLGRPLHVLVNNAYSGGAGTIKLATASQYAETYEITVTAAHNLLRAVLPSLRLAAQTDGDASVINMATMYGMVSPDLRLYESAEEYSNPPFYGAAKAALLQWTRYAACEFGPERIRVNSVTPGPFPPAAVLRDNPDFISRLEKKVPLGRVGRPEEIAGPIVFLASKASSFVNGANLVVDGGWTAW
jgi:NAD(P)-dependent dehydrogenase (short-subunit alcohol dehydrogenase family)